MGWRVVGLIYLVATLFWVRAIVGGDHAGMIFGFCVLVAPPLFWFVFVRETYCKVATIGARPCPRPARGIILGCTRHRLAKVTVRLGLGGDVTVGRLRPRRPISEIEQTGARRGGDGAITFWALIVATAAISVTAIVSFTAMRR